jgi:hypothetical protein
MFSSRGERHEIDYFQPRNSESRRPRYYRRCGRRLRHRATGGDALEARAAGALTPKREKKYIMLGARNDETRQYMMFR